MGNSNNSMRKSYFCKIAVLSFIETIAIIVQAYYMGEIVDHANVKFSLVLSMVIIIAATMIIEIVSRMLMNYWLNKYCNKRRCEFGEKLVGKLLTARFDELEKLETGTILNIYTSDIERILEYDKIIFRVGAVILKVLLPLFFLFSMNPLVSGCILVVSILSLLPGMLVGNYQYEKRSQLNQKSDELNERFLKHVNLVKVIKAYNAEEYYAEKSKDSIKEYQKSKNSLEQNIVLYSVLNRTFSILPFLSLYVVGAIFVIKGSFTVGEIVASSFFIGILSEGIGGVQSVFQARQSSYKSSKERLEGVQEWKEGGLKRVKKFAPETEIALLNVSFGYETERDVLCEVTLSIKEKSKLMLRGESGCGKTTLFRVLEGLYEPTKGILEWRTKQKAEEGGMVILSVAEQETILFPRTVRENICMVNKDLTEEQFQEICRVACVDDSLLYEDGKERVVTELGKNLSKGQLQRINLARALAKDAEVYLFDEPTAGLNTELEEQVIHNVLWYLREKTVIMILHNSRYQELFTEVFDMNLLGGNV